MPVRRILRLVLATVFLVASILHVVVPEPFLDITPDWVPWAPAVVRLTGLTEIAGPPDSWSHD